MTRDSWRSADREAEVCAAERDVESVGLGPVRVRELVDGAVAVLDVDGRTHAVIGWQKCPPTAAGDGEGDAGDRRAA